MRVSLLGGGSDYKRFFESSPGYVLGSSIDKFVYVSLLPLPEFAEEKYRFTYRITESVEKITEFKHPVIREVLIQRNWSQPINIGTMADLPGRSGLGSSSSFTVGLIKALDSFEGKLRPGYQLALEAVNIERNRLEESGGWQDQFHAAIGGLNLYKFSEKTVNALELIIQRDVSDYISASLVLVPMNNWRDSSKFAAVTETEIGSQNGKRLVEELAEITLEAAQKLNSANTIKSKFQFLVEAMNYSWEIKKYLSKGGIQKPVFDTIKLGMENGALAGKLCGAGGTGFVLFLVPPAFRTEFVHRLDNFFAFPVSFSNSGSEILF